MAGIKLVDLVGVKPYLEYVSASDRAKIIEVFDRLEICNLGTFDLHKINQIFEDGGSPETIVENLEKYLRGFTPDVKDIDDYKFPDSKKEITGSSIGKNTEVDGREVKINSDVKIANTQKQSNQTVEALVIGWIENHHITGNITARLIHRAKSIDWNLQTLPQERRFKEVEILDPAILKLASAGALFELLGKTVDRLHYEIKTQSDDAKKSRPIEILEEELKEEAEGESTMERIAEFISDNRKYFIIGASVVILLLIVSLAAFLLLKNSGSSDQVSITNTQVPTIAAVVPAQAPTEENHEAAPTQIPTLQPTPNALLAAGCSGGFMVTIRYPSSEAIGHRGWRTLDFVEDPAQSAPEFQDKAYYVTTVAGRPEVFLVQTSEGAYFVPASWFQSIISGEQCAQEAEVNAFSDALTRLEPDSGKSPTILDVPDLKYPTLIVMWVIACLVIWEFIQRKSWLAPFLFAFLIPLTIWLMDGTDKKHMPGLFLFGMLASLGYGLWENKAEIVDLIKKNIPSNNRNDEVKALIESQEGIRQLISMFNWSVPAAWCTFNLMGELILEKGSPLRSIGNQEAVILLGLLILFCFLMESARRNRAGDWLGLLAAVAGGISVGVILHAIEPGSGQQLGLLLSLFVPVLIIALVGRSESNLIEEDRIIDLINATLSFALIALAITSRIWPAI